MRVGLDDALRDPAEVQVLLPEAFADRLPTSSSVSSHAEASPSNLRSCSSFVGPVQIVRWPHVGDPHTNWRGRLCGLAEPPFRPDTAVQDPCEATPRRRRPTTSQGLFLMPHMITSLLTVRSNLGKRWSAWR